MAMTLRDAHSACSSMAANAVRSFISATLKLMRSEPKTLTSRFRIYCHTKTRQQIRRPRMKTR
jgi:predicted lipoprotein